MFKSANLHIMIKAAEKAAQAIVRDFGELEKLQISRKGTKSFVTSADKFAEKKIIEALSAARPSYSFVCEESGNINNLSKETWIVDPIDGTNNFMRGIPYFAINIALMNDNEIFAGVTFDPLRRDCFYADTGSGSYLDNRIRLRVSGRETFKESIIAIHSPLKDLKIINETAILRKTGSVALDLAYLAAGKYDAVIAKGVDIWDIASGIILVKEAGGLLNYFKDPTDNRYTILAASSQKLLEQIGQKI